jgi:hypothetical protein
MVACDKGVASPLPAALFAFSGANQPAAKEQAVTWAANRQRPGEKAAKLVEGQSCRELMQRPTVHLDEGNARGTVSVSFGRNQ